MVAAVSRAGPHGGRPTREMTTGPWSFRFSQADPPGRTEITWGTRRRPAPRPRRDGRSTRGAGTTSRGGAGALWHWWVMLERRLTEGHSGGAGASSLAWHGSAKTRRSSSVA